MLDRDDSDFIVDFYEIDEPTHADGATVPLEERVLRIGGRNRWNQCDPIKNGLNDIIGGLDGSAICLDIRMQLV